MATDVHRDELRHLLHAGDVPRALAYLHLVSPYRFAAMYRIDAGRLHNLVFLDRDDPAASRQPPVAQDQSYCAIVQASGEALVLHDAGADPRVAGHPARETVRAYCGLPLLRADGVAIGSICLFDTTPVAEDPYILGLLSEVAAALDPADALAAIARGLDRRIDALAAMAALIAGASEGGAAALAAFADYASPIRERARVSLDAAGRAALDARLGALEADLLRKVAQARGPDAPSA